MIETIQDVLEKVTLFDYIYIILTILLMVRGAIKGFVLSILSTAKWILAYVLTIYIFPKAKPYVENILDNEYVLDLILGIGLFVIIIFLILMINKAISKAVSYSGIGTIDKVFGLIFLDDHYFFHQLNVFLDHQKIYFLSYKYYNHLLRLRYCLTSLKDCLPSPEIPR